MSTIVLIMVSIDIILIIIHLMARCRNEGVIVLTIVTATILSALWGILAITQDFAPIWVEVVLPVGYYVLALIRLISLLKAKKIKYLIKKIEK